MHIDPISNKGTQESQKVLWVALQTGTALPLSGPSEMVSPKRNKPLPGNTAGPC